MLIDLTEQTTVATSSNPHHGASADNCSDAASIISEFSDGDHAPTLSVQEIKKDKREQALACYLRERETRVKIDDVDYGDWEDEQQSNIKDRIIDNARSYQQELFERAKDENVIAVSVLHSYQKIQTDTR